MVPGTIFAFFLCWRISHLTVKLTPFDVPPDVVTFMIVLPFGIPEGTFTFSFVSVQLE